MWRFWFKDACCFSSFPFFKDQFQFVIKYCFLYFYWSEIVLNNIFLVTNKIRNNPIKFENQNLVTLGIQRTKVLILVRKVFPDKETLLSLNDWRTRIIGNLFKGHKYRCSIGNWNKWAYPSGIICSKDPLGINYIPL